MVHVFSLLDLVEKNDKTVTPIRTWSVHHLPVTHLLTMPSGRMIAASEDGQIVMMELFSEKVVFTIQMPHAIRALAHCTGRLFAGAAHGSVYLIDLDLYAMHQTSQLGITVKHIPRAETHEDQVFSADSSEAYKTELLGHEKPITSLAVFTEDDCEWLVSGDDAGEVRLWHLQSRGCVRVIRPWANSVAAAPKTSSTSSGKSPAKQTLHPVTSILIVPREETADKPDLAFHAGSKERKTKTGIVTLIPPLQRFIDRLCDTADEKKASIPVPFLQPKRGHFETAGPDAASVFGIIKGAGAKRLRAEEAGAAAKAEPSVAGQSEELLRLTRELEEAQSTIQRWEEVNNTLMTKLKQSQS